MEVSVTAFRADLKKYLDLVRAGEEIVVTDRGVPVARMTPVGEAEWLEQLTREGILSRPLAPKQKVAVEDLIKADGSVTDYIIEMRRGRDDDLLR
jgi:prevent-host-death family protein